MLHPQGAGEAHEPESIWSRAQKFFWMVQRLGVRSGGHVVPEWGGPAEDRRVMFVMYSY